MGIEEIKKFILEKQGAILDFPFGEEVEVYKVGNKMFALVNVHEPDRQSINLKYPKDKIHEIRSVFSDIIPGYHMHKNHWNTVYVDGNLEDELIKELIDISYELVFSSLTKKAQRDILGI